MCDIDAEDGQGFGMGMWRAAAKEHKCGACLETIPKGHHYHIWSSVLDGRWASIKHCARCWAMVKALHASGFADVVELELNCGETWEDASGEPPPAEVAALAFWLPGEPLPTDFGQQVDPPKET